MLVENRGIDFARAARRERRRLEFENATVFPPPGIRIPYSDSDVWKLLDALLPETEEVERMEKRDAD